MTDVTVTLNGKPRQVADGVTLLDLLTQLDVQPSRVVIEHNREIRRRDDFAKTVVRAGDELELVSSSAVGPQPATTLSLSAGGRCARD